MNKRIILVSILSVLSIGFVIGQNIIRPSIWGIAKITFLVSDISMAREYYGRFLGFDEAFSYSSTLGKIVSFKVNDRQFLEFVVDKQAKEKKRLVSVSLEVESVTDMQHYLHSQGLNVALPSIDGAGNEVITVQDTWGNNVEFISYRPNGLHIKTTGKFLSSQRISKRILHVGLYSGKVDDNDTFWSGVLKCREVLRYPLDRSQPAAIQYLDLGNCTESIEHYSPCDENFAHPCFLTPDMQETIYTLKKRQGNQKLDKPVIGRTNRWLLNLLTPDNTKVEFAEPYCVR